MPDHRFIGPDPGLHNTSPPIRDCPYHACVKESPLLFKHNGLMAESIASCADFIRVTYNSNPETENLPLLATDRTGSRFLRAMVEKRVPQ